LEISRSRIFANGGLLPLANLFPPSDLDRLEAEASRASAEGHRNELAVSGAGERGGSPERAFTHASGGMAQWTLFSAASFVARLGEVCGLDLAPTGGGSYSYYEQEGDFLGLHRDIVTCELTVVTCVRTAGVKPGAGSLLVYSDYMNAPLARARAAGRGAARQAPIGRGESVALLGGFVPHEVTPMLNGQERVVSVMCYRAAF
jgi:hypothetical protein